jgi:hypothetical protein
MAARFQDDPGRALAALYSIDPGLPRDAWLRCAMGAKAAGIDESAFIAWSSGAGNYSGPSDCRAVWRSISTDRGVTAATLFGMARDAGWSDASPRNDYAQARPRIAPASPQKPVGRPAFDFAAVWAGAEPAAATHAYIQRKLGLPDGLRVHRGQATIAGQSLDGALLVPAWGSAGELVSWQAIPAEAGARKLNAPGQPMAGTFVIGGPVRTSEPAYITEGLGTAWSAHQATGKPALVAFGSSRMKQAAQSLLERFPGCVPVLVADVGQEAHCEAVAAAVGGLWVGLPAGWAKNADVNDLHQRDGLEAVAELLNQAKRPERLEPRYKLLRSDDLAGLPPLRWLVRGVLPATGLGALFGPSGSGKSFLTLDLAAAVAQGVPWFGIRTTAAPVVYCVLEGEAGVRLRAQAWEKNAGRKLPDTMRFVMQPFRLTDAGDVQDMAAAVLEAGGRGALVVVDTLSRATPGADENSSVDMGAAIEAAKRLQSSVEGAVLVVAHTGKDATRGLRGHSSLHAALDAAIVVSRDGDVRSWSVAKSKDGADEGSYGFRLESVELGMDDDEPLTSCVVAPVEASEPAKPKLPGAGSGQRAAWDAIGQALREAGDARPHGAPEALPWGRPTLTTDAALDAIAARLIVEPKRRRERSRLALQGLIDRGLLHHADGWVWCT